jgi:single-stranded-DNA-specific exonuclease
VKMPGVEWLEPVPVTPLPELLAQVVGHPLVAELITRRNLANAITVAAFLNPDLYTPADPLDLPDLSIAADRLDLAIQNGENIAVWGDFDVDGQTSTALLVSGLRSLGADVIYHIPVRARESHGINLPNLQMLLDQGAQLILTCDTGITAHEAAEYLQSRKIDLLITDHHTLPDELPPAPAVINPQRLPEGHPLRSLCGVGTAYQLLSELLRRRDRVSDAETYLDLVALGTVADVALLKGDNRWLVQRGLQLLRSQTRPGLQAILSLAELSPARLSEEHIGFALAPRLNAIGRLGDANPVVELLTTPEIESARPLALELEALNSRRKRLCDDVFRAAQSQVERNPSLLDPPFLLLDHPTWPAGVIGIVASRLAELYTRPVALIATPPGQPGRASARSVESVNITAALAENSGLLLGFGGHPMAAGFSILPEKINDLRRGVSRSIQRQTFGQPMVNRLQIDAWLPLTGTNLDLVEDLDRLSPFGAGNPSPVFAVRNLRLVNATGLGKGGEHLQIIVENENDQQARLIWWGAAGNPLPTGWFDLAYTLRASNYRGAAEVTLEWVSARVREDLPPVEFVSPLPFNVTDLRQSTDPLVHLDELDLHPDTQFWWEVDCPAELPGVNRLQLRPCHTLVIATVPPDRHSLAAALLVAQPQRMILFGHIPPTDTMRNLLFRLSGLIHFVQNNRGSKIMLDELASACASTNSAIRFGLEWWQAKGSIRIDWLEDGQVEIKSLNRPNPTILLDLEKQVELVLEETTAFRAYYRRAPVSSLLRV